MKRHCAWLVLFVALVLRASAQVSVEVVLDQEQFLPGEEMVAAIKITNRSGEVLHFGKTSEWLTLLIEGEGSYSAEVSSVLPDGTSFSLESSRLATKRLNLEPYFILTKPGRYRLSAKLRVPGLDQTVVSPLRKFDVITGTRLWEQEFGVPDSGHPPVVRSYLLQQANYLKQLQLYLRVTESREERPIRVVRLGQMVSFGQPTALLDRRSDLHLMFQNGPRSWRYCVFTPDGNCSLRQTHAMSENRPRLVVDEQGAVLVKGGLRAKTADDLPPEPEPEPPDATPASTNQVVPPPP